MKTFQKYRSLGPDGWMVDFFLYFFNMVEKDLLRIVEDIILEGKVLGNINSTCIAIILEKYSHESFNEYHMISLCNMIYKIISKVVDLSLKPILSRVI